MRFSDQVEDVLDAEGISHQEAEVMLTRAAITSILGANRRYHSWLFQLQGDLVVRMFKLNPGDESVPKWGTHARCHGWGCPKCGWHGKVPAR